MKELQKRMNGNFAKVAAKHTEDLQKMLPESLKLLDKLDAAGVTKAPKWVGHSTYIFDQDDPELAAEQHRLATEGGFPWDDNRIDEEVPAQIKCECGSEKVGSPRHSSYCPKYVEER